MPGGRRAPGGAYKLTRVEDLALVLGCGKSVEIGLVDLHKRREIGAYQSRWRGEQQPELVTQLDPPVPRSSKASSWVQDFDHLALEVTPPLATLDERRNL